MKSDSHAEVYRGHEKIAIHNLMVGFAGKVTKFLQMNHIVDQLKGTRVEVCCNICFTGSNVFRIEEIHSFEI